MSERSEQPLSDETIFRGMVGLCAVTFSGLALYASSIAGTPKSTEQAYEGCSMQNQSAAACAYLRSAEFEQVDIKGIENISWGMSAACTSLIIALGLRRKGRSYLVQREASQILKEYTQP